MRLFRPGYLRYFFMIDQEDISYPLFIIKYVKLDITGSNFYNELFEINSSVFTTDVAFSKCCTRKKDGATGILCSNAG